MSDSFVTVHIPDAHGIRKTQRNGLPLPVRLFCFDTYGGPFGGPWRSFQGPSRFSAVLNIKFSKNCMAKSILAALDSIDFHRSRDYGLCEEYGRAIVNRRKKNMTIILC